MMQLQNLLPKWVTMLNRPILAPISKIAHLREWKEDVILLGLTARFAKLDTLGENVSRAYAQMLIEWNS